MILGCFIRGYKIFSNLKFISLFGLGENKLAFFIGENGSGKSSILEALDVVFNNREWNYNINSKRLDASICPIFLIKKSEYRGNTDILSKISDFFWGFKWGRDINSVEAFSQFISYRDEIRAYFSPADYYLIAVGYDCDSNIQFTSFADTNLRNSFKPRGISGKELDAFGRSVLSLYRYIYFPVNVDAAEMLAIQSNSLQGLMDRDILERMNEMLDGPENSIVSDINKKLNEFLQEINKNLNKDGYVFSTPTIGKKNVTAEDITDAIVNCYFNLRVLQKEKTPVMNLSSGEQRRALLDVATAFITNGTNRKRKLIFGVDEPEASLSVSACLDQFRKIARIAESNDTQVMVATHWYGILMTAMQSSLHHLKNSNNKIEVLTFDLESVHEQRRKFPAAVEMKSFFDLMATIFSTIKLTNEKWIICEGSDDKNYLHKLLNCDDVNVLPVGGVANVIKLFNYFKAVLSSDNKEVDLMSGKILFIIDSDAQRIDVDANLSVDASKHVKILRFQIDRNGNPTLVTPTASGYYTETELEDCLDAKDFYDASKEILTNNYTNFDRNFKLNTAASFAKVNQGIEFLSLKKLEGDRDRLLIKNLLSDRNHKFKISEKYQSNNKLDWVDKISDFFAD